MGWFSGGDGIKSSDFDPSLPDNKAESDAAAHAAKESPMEKAYGDYKAAESSNSLWESIFGKK